MEPEGTNKDKFHTGRGRGRPRKEKPEVNLGSIVMEDVGRNQANESKIISQLGKDLSNENLENEKQMLSKVPFPSKQKKPSSNLITYTGPDSDNFTPLDWYVEVPLKDD